jgi:biotin transport system substrate-specific component
VAGFRGGYIMSKTQKITLTALFAALICAIAPLSVPIGPIPITLATFAIYLAAATLGKKLGTLSVLVYILVGIVGFPVFAGFSSGLPKIIGVTGGFIVGYIPLAFIAGSFKEFRGSWKYPVGMAAGTVALYILGVVWYSVVTGSGLIASVTVCVVPFLPGDALKIVAASIIAVPLSVVIQKRSVKG